MADLKRALGLKWVRRAPGQSDRLDVVGHDGFLVIRATEDGRLAIGRDFRGPDHPATVRVRTDVPLIVDIRDGELHVSVHASGEAGEQRPLEALVAYAPEVE